MMAWRADGFREQRCPRPGFGGAGMARATRPPTQGWGIDALLERWKRECLLRYGSLLFDDRQLWPAAHIAGESHASLGVPPC